MSPRRSSILVAIILASISTAVAAPDESVRVSVTRLVAKIQRADYEGDRAALKRLYEELGPFVENKGLAVRVRYWSDLPCGGELLTVLTSPLIQKS